MLFVSLAATEWWLLWKCLITQKSDIAFIHVFVYSWLYLYILLHLYLHLLAWLVSTAMIAIYTHNNTKAKEGVVGETTLPRQIQLSLLCWKLKKSRKSCICCCICACISSSNCICICAKAKEEVVGDHQPLWSDRFNYISWFAWDAPTLLK